MNTYILYWLHGKLEKITGESISDAFNKAGYGGGAIRALDFYEQNETPTWHWDNQSNKWGKS
jgi:hypothetical protein